MEKRNQSIEEYKHLYSEIHSNSDKVSFALNLMFTLTSAIIAYGLKDYENSSEIIFLTPLIFIIPLSHFIYSQMNSTVRIAMYIKVFHESKENGLQWENRFGKFKTPKELNHSKYAKSLKLIVMGLVSICILLTVLRLSHSLIQQYELITLNENSVIIVRGILALIAIVGVVRILRKILRSIDDTKSVYATKYFEEWNKIKKKEKENTEANNA